MRWAREHLDHGVVQVKKFNSLIEMDGDTQRDRENLLPLKLVRR
jgi:hypothetical protein